MPQPFSPPHAPRAVFLFPENESIGFHSPLALPWTDGNSSSTGQPVLVIALNMTSPLPPLIYVHANRIPIALYACHDKQQGVPVVGQQLPLECQLQHGV